MFVKGKGTEITAQPESTHQSPIQWSTKNFNIRLIPIENLPHQKLNSHIQVVMHLY